MSRWTYTTRANCYRKVRQQVLILGTWLCCWISEWDHLLYINMVVEQILSEYLVMGIWWWEYSQSIWCWGSWWLLLLARGMSAINLGCTGYHSPAQMFSLLLGGEHGLGSGVRKWEADPQGRIGGTEWCNRFWTPLRHHFIKHGVNGMINIRNENLQFLRQTRIQNQINQNFWQLCIWVS